MYIVVCCSTRSWTSQSHLFHAYEAVHWDSNAVSNCMLGVASVCETRVWVAGAYCCAVLVVHLSDTFCQCTCFMLVWLAHAKVVMNKSIVDGYEQNRYKTNVWLMVGGWMHEWTYSGIDKQWINAWMIDRISASTPYYWCWNDSAIGYCTSPDLFISFLLVAVSCSW